MTNTKLKAYVRFDGSGRIVPSSLILQRFKPKDGNWRQINSKECCLNNECSAPDENYILNVTSPEDESGLLFYFATNPYINYSIQFQFISCVNGPGEIITVGKQNDYEYSVFLTNAQLADVCGLQVRHLCGPDLYSAWTSNFGG